MIKGSLKYTEGAAFPVPGQAEWLRVARLEFSSTWETSKSLRDELLRARAPFLRHPFISGKLIALKLLPGSTLTVAWASEPSIMRKGPTLESAPLSRSVGWPTPAP